MSCHPRLRELMTVQCDVRFSAPQRREIEDKIRAVEAWHDLLDDARIDMYSCGQSKRVLKEMPNSEMPLSLWPENDRLSER
jgi:hypothetical protein